MPTADPAEILSRRNAEIQKIQGYADLTEETKNRRINEVTQRANSEYAEARETAKRGRASYPAEIWYPQPSSPSSPTS